MNRPPDSYFRRMFKLRTKFLRLHLLTWLAIELTVVGFVLLQICPILVPQSDSSGSMMSGTWGWGWPALVVTNVGSIRVWPDESVSQSREWRYGAIVLNGVVSVAYVFLAALMTERWSRAANPLRTRVTSALTFLGALGVTLGIVNYIGAMIHLSIAGCLGLSETASEITWSIDWIATRASLELPWYLQLMIVGMMTETLYLIGSRVREHYHTRLRISRPPNDPLSKLRGERFAATDR